MQVNAQFPTLLKFGVILLSFLLVGMSFEIEEIHTDKQEPLLEQNVVNHSQSIEQNG